MGLSKNSGERLGAVAVLMPAYLALTPIFAFVGFLWMYRLARALSASKRRAITTACGYGTLTGLLPLCGYLFSIPAIAMSTPAWPVVLWLVASVVICTAIAIRRHNAYLRDIDTASRL